MRSLVLYSYCAVAAFAFSFAFPTQSYAKVINPVSLMDDSLCSSNNESEDYLLFAFRDAVLFSDAFMADYRVIPTLNPKQGDLSVTASGKIEKYLAVLKKSQEYHVGAEGFTDEEKKIVAESKTLLEFLIGTKVPDLSGDSKFKYEIREKVVGPVASAEMLRRISDFLLLKTDESGKYLTSKYLTISCKPAASEPTTVPVDKQNPLRIASTIVNIAEEERENREFATLALDYDMLSKKKSKDLQFAIGVFDNNESKTGVALQTQYKTNKDGEIKADDLRLSLLRDFQFYPSKNFGLHSTFDLSYETDTHLRSQVYSMGLKTKFVNSNEKGFLGFLKTDLCVAKDIEVDFKCFFDVNWLADYYYVEDPGRKENLIDAKGFFRTGVMSTMDIHKVFDSDSKLGLKLRYTTYKKHSGKIGNVNLFTSSLYFEPDSKNGIWKFSLDYEDGADLTSFEMSKTAKVTVGLRY